LHAVPTRLKSAVRLEDVVLKFEALYPGHDANGSLEFARGTIDVADTAAAANASQENRIAIVEINWQTGTPKSFKRLLEP
jgi:hypothetical protein